MFQSSVHRFSPEGCAGPGQGWPSPLLAMAWPGAVKAMATLGVTTLDFHEGQGGVGRCLAQGLGSSMEMFFELHSNVALLHIKFSAQFILESS